MLPAEGTGVVSFLDPRFYAERVIEVTLIAEQRSNLVIFVEVDPTDCTLLLNSIVLLLELDSGQRGKDVCYW